MRIDHDRFERAPCTGRRPLIGVLCCNERHDRDIQAVATRFIEPLTRLSGATVLLVPALVDACDARGLSGALDGLLLTGSRSNVGPEYYGGTASEGPRDEQRDAVALRLAGTMIDAGKPVFGICRGLQELNVLFGGSLTPALAGDVHHHPGAVPYEDLFAHSHEVELAASGLFNPGAAPVRERVNSVHYQGIDRLGGGLTVEARACDDGLVEAFSAAPAGSPVLAVQWHPEWQGAKGPADRPFFDYLGKAARGATLTQLAA